MSIEYNLRLRQAREAAKKFGRMIKRGDCHGARKQKGLVIKAVSQAMSLVGRRPEVQRLDDGLARMDAKLDRCAIQMDYTPPGGRRRSRS